MKAVSKELPTINFLGVGVHALIYEDMFDVVDGWLEDKESRSHHIACLNAYGVTLTLNDPDLATIYNGADITGPDGMPFVYWIRGLHHLECDRHSAPEIVMQLAHRSQKTDYSFYLYGGSPDVVVGMKNFLEEKFANIRIVGFHSPPFRKLSEEEDKKICDEINFLKPDILCVGLGTPKQDYWIDSHIHRIKGTVMISCGATFDFFGGRVRMAPRVIQRSGFEWLYRLLGPDFQRLWRRYTVINVIFVWNFVLQLLRLRVRDAVRWKRSG